MKLISTVLIYNVSVSHGIRQNGGKKKGGSI